MFIYSTLTHRYDTRHRGRPHAARPNKETTKKTIRYYIPQLLTEAPDDIKFKIKTHSLQKNQTEGKNNIF